jgi:hypothetical protein
MSLPAAHKRLHAVVAYCLFYHQRYRGRFHTLKTIDTSMKEVSSGGKIINRFTSRNAAFQLMVAVIMPNMIFTARFAMFSLAQRGRF